MPLGTFPRGLNVPPPAKDSTPVDYAEALGETYLSFSKHNHRKSVGHYLTPATIARFMADCSSYSEPYMRVLDPGSGNRHPVRCGVRGSFRRRDRQESAR